MRYEVKASTYSGVLHSKEDLRVLVTESMWTQGCSPPDTRYLFMTVDMYPVSVGNGVHIEPFSVQH